MCRKVDVNQQYQPKLLLVENIIMDGNMLEIPEEMSLHKEYGEFLDLVLIDTKEDCLKYFDLAFLMMRIKGMIVTDNMLYSEIYKVHMSGFAVKLGKNPSVCIMTSGIGNGEEIAVMVARLAYASKIMVILSGSRK